MISVEVEGGGLGVLGLDWGGVVRVLRGGVGWVWMFCCVFVLRKCEGEHVKHTHPGGIDLFCMIPEHLFV